MTAGYVVSDDPADRNSTTHPGAGQAAAVAWLDRLRALARRMCVASTPYAQADLDALHRVGDPGLASIATNGAGDIVDQILGVTSTRGATLLGDGSLTAAAADLLGAQGPTVAIAAADCTAQDEVDGKLRTGQRQPAPALATTGDRPVRSDGRRRARGRRAHSRLAVVPGPLAGRALHARLGHRTSPGRDRRDAVARTEPRQPAPQPDPDAAAVLGSAGARRAVDHDRIRHRDPRRSCAPPAAGRRDRRCRGNRRPELASRWANQIGAARSTTR